MSGTGTNKCSNCVTQTKKQFQYISMPENNYEITYDVAEFKDKSEPEFTDHVDSAGVFAQCLQGYSGRGFYFIKQKIGLGHTHFWFGSKCRYRNGYLYLLT